MSGFGPALACLAAALALHLAVLAGFDPPQSASGAGGEGGDAVATLQAAPGDLAALVAQWDQPPDLGRSARNPASRAGSHTRPAAITCARCRARVHGTTRARDPSGKRPSPACAGAATPI